jgi:membrane protein YdbS with pleckstrin-like domain
MPSPALPAKSMPEEESHSPILLACFVQPKRKTPLSYMQAKNTAAGILEIERPSPQLLSYYIVKCLVAGPFFPFIFLPHYFKYRTLRYRFDEEGISMRWGILFRREIILNYSRIQDIHLSSNVIERWMGLAKVEIQTASGSAKAEMTIEGVMEFEALRDFVYAKMRGIKDHTQRKPQEALPISTSSEALTETLNAVADELRALRLTLERRDGNER